MMEFVQLGLFDASEPLPGSEVRFDFAGRLFVFRLSTPDQRVELPCPNEQARSSCPAGRFFPFEFWRCSICYRRRELGYVD